MSELGSTAVRAYWASAGNEEKRRRAGLMKAATRRRYALPVGISFGRWTVQNYHGPDGYTCLCACGTSRIVRRYCLVSGESISCGCYAREFGQAKRRDDARQTNLRALFCATRIRAKRHKHRWRLSLYAFRKLIFQPCHYCGVVGTNHKKTTRKDGLGGFYYNGLDRMESNRGYILRNVVPCCKVCNRAKSDMTVADFQAWLDQLVVYARERQS